MFFHTSGACGNSYPFLMNRIVCHRFFEGAGDAWPKAGPDKMSFEAACKIVSNSGWLGWLGWLKRELGHLPAICPFYYQTLTGIKGIHPFTLFGGTA